MGVTKNNFIEALKNTDNLINQENITHLLKPLPETIKIITQACDSLFNKQYSLFLTGSLAICLRSGSLKEFRTLGDKSDIDLWIITNKSSKKSSKPSRFEKEIMKGLGRLNYFDISCIPFLSSKFKISLKIMHSVAVRKILQLNKISLKVFRENSLRKVKGEDTFYGMRREYHISILEEKLENGGFLWHWSADPFIKDDFVLTDIHSCFLIGGFLTDGFKMKKARDLFLKKFYYYFRKYRKKIAADNQFKILQYFYNGFPSSAIKIFGKEKGADSFIENAP